MPLTSSFVSLQCTLHKLKNGRLYNHDASMALLPENVPELMNDTLPACQTSNGPVPRLGSPQLTEESLSPTLLQKHPLDIREMIGLIQLGEALF